MRNRRLLFALFLCLAMVFGSVAWATEIMPLWDSCAMCAPDLYISGNTANQMFMRKIVPIKLRLIFICKSEIAEGITQHSKAGQIRPALENCVFQQPVQPAAAKAIALNVMWLLMAAAARIILLFMLTAISDFVKLGELSPFGGILRIGE